jgi:Rrf2 family protein
MRFCQKTEYALKTLIDLAQHRDDGIASASAIARRQNIPVKFLEQILMPLRSADLITSKRGPKGGYHLTSDPEEITVGEIVRLSEGNGSTISFAQDAPCAVRELWHEIDGALDRKLNSVTIQDLVERTEELVNSKEVSFVI